MSKFESVVVKMPDGILRSIDVRVSEDEPWELEFCGFDGIIQHYRGTDLFEALRAMREDFQSVGCQLLCAGARLDVTPSRMSRSMSGGRKVYIVHAGRAASLTDLVDIFEYADATLVGTVEQQKKYIQSWLQSLQGIRERR